MISSELLNPLSIEEHSSSSGSSSSSSSSSNSGGVGGEGGEDMGAEGIGVLVNNVSVASDHPVTLEDMSGSEVDSMMFSNMNVRTTIVTITNHVLCM